MELKFTLVKTGFTKVVMYATLSVLNVCYWKCFSAFKLSLKCPEFFIDKTKLILPRCCT